MAWPRFRFPSCQLYLTTSAHTLYLFKDSLKVMAVGRQAFNSLSIHHSGFVGKD